MEDKEKINQSAEIHEEELDNVAGGVIQPGKPALPLKRPGEIEDEDSLVNRQPDKQRTRFF